MKRICPKCQHIESKSTICGNCGEVLVSAEEEGEVLSRCPDCRGLMRDGVCNDCGTTFVVTRPTYVGVFGAVL